MLLLYKIINLSGELLLSLLIICCNSCCVCFVFCLLISRRINLLFVVFGNVIFNIFVLLFK